jgi:3-oxoacyl-[acyl-carrier protein] reductase
MQAAMASAKQWQTALVTGAASGIGRAFACELGRRGIALGLIDVFADGLTRTADLSSKTSARVESRVADVSDANAVTRAVEELVSQLGALDLVIHCAAILGPGQFATQPAADFDKVVSIDLLGTANVLRAVLPALRRSRGAVACVASTAAVHGWPALAAYSAAKFGVAGFCDAVRGELRRDGVTLTAVFPLLIDTPLLLGADIAPILKQGRRLPPESVVKKTLAGAAAGKPRVFVPGSVRLIAALHGLAPSLLDWYGRRFGL